MAESTRNAAIEYLAVTRIGEKGQITVPKSFRQAFRLETGAPFAVLRLGAGLILFPEQQRFEDLCQRISSALAGSGVKVGDLLATLPKARRRVYDRHYGAVGASAATASKRTRRRHVK